MNTLGDWIPIILALIGAIGGIGAFVNGRRQTMTQEATTMVNDALRLIEPYKNRVTQLENELVELNVRINQLEAEVAKLTICNEKLRGDDLDLREWADRLVHQVQSYGGTPVKLRPRKASAA